MSSDEAEQSELWKMWGLLEDLDLDFDRRKKTRCEKEARQVCNRKN
jgi:hypothetical protein